MAIKSLITSAAAALIGMSSLNAQAASTWLKTVIQSPTISGVANLELWADGEGVAFLAGGLDVFYDETIVSYNDDFAFDAAFPTDPDFSRPGTSGDPDNCTTDPSALGCSGPGEINGIAFGNFNGIADTVTLVGTLSFTGLSVGVSAITMATNDLPAGDWFDVSGSPMDVVYRGAQFGVPVPAAVWLMTSGLAALFGFARKRKTV
jgi:hypothetical protein